MRLEVVSNLISFVGKKNEEAYAEKCLRLIGQELGFPVVDFFDNGDDEHMDLGVAYDQKFYTVEECRQAWRTVKSDLKHS